MREGGTRKEGRKEKRAGESKKGPSLLALAPTSLL